MRRLQWRTLQHPTGRHRRLRLPGRVRASAAVDRAGFDAPPTAKLLSFHQTAREQQPNDSNIADTLGWVYYKKNANLLAMSLLKEAAEKLPNEPVVHFHYGMAQQKNGDQAGAKKSLQTALKLSQTFDGSEEAKKTLAGL